MSEGTPADLGTLWGSGLIFRNDVCPCPCLPPSPGPPRPCSTLMPKALPRRHEVEEMNASLARKRGVRRRGGLPGDERSPSPRADEGRTWGAGRGLSARVVRRLDDLDKMATLQGGLLGPDPGALSPAQQEQLRNFKIQTRIANEKYLRTHKEVELLISGFFREMFLKRPDNIQEFAADYFTDPRLPNKIHMQLIKEKKAA
ncbi:RIIa domain-containing protein 1 [Zalophus californianus]|uniref:RIIa domain-containing protein 1 n=3 Tax=Pinnipedia TaxID=3072905 RepID=A0A3Q7N035_CALUR|nr:RIIa domain-containing protein 1 [Callorhinus ursinus]XP_027480921.1 RIIa domain-containing protein 1 [Zalophus californianus]